MSNTNLSVRVTQTTYEAEGVLSFEFRAISDDVALLPFTAGSHIDVYMHNGIARSYSLCNDPADAERYVVAVGLDQNSRGGSRFLHEELRVGEVLQISRPRNNFPLVEDGAHSIFVAGGIGVTPIWSMIQRLSHTHGSWEMFYGARSRKNAAFVPQLERAAQAAGGHVIFHFDDEKECLPNLKAYIDGAAREAHAYCCGPAPMLEAFEAAAAEVLPSDQVHVEYFKARETVGTTGAFTVSLAKSKMSLDVPEGKTILDVVLDAGIDVPFSCMDGICGSCAVKILDGVPDHRDMVLSDAQKRANDTVIICCSRSKSATLVLDI